MTDRDVFGLIASYLYSFGMLALTTAIQIRLKLPQDFTRKVVHVGAGMWIFGLYGLFDTWYWGVLPIATFILFNYVSYKFKLVKAMDLSDSSPGTVYFVISITILLSCFWPRGQFWIAAAGIMAMTWGDAFASIVGRGWGKHFYFIRQHRRSYEGSAAMFGFSFVAIWLVLALMNTGLDAFKIFTFSLVLASLATFLEAIALHGLDNLLVPIGTSMALFALVSWPVSPLRLLLGLVISVLIGLVAYQRKALSPSGVMGAIITGSLIFGFGGWVWGLMLIAFFVYGTLLSKYKESQKNVVAADKFDKGSRRDIGQALANGGLGAVLAGLFLLFPEHSWLFAAFVGTMATVNADTWATELGVLSRRPPRLITSGKEVPPGTSGGITLLGTSATALGGLVIGATGFGLLFGRKLLHSDFNLGAFWWVLPVGLAAGLLGSLSDSLLGATVQAMYYNPSKGKETEKKVDRSGQKNEFLRGWRFMDNDAVNFLSSAFGAGVAVLLYLLIA